MPVATNFHPARLASHYAAHKNDFGASDANNYQDLARSFLNKPLAAGGNIEQCVRMDGDIVRFDKATDEFATMRSDGTIKTYYKPMMNSTAPPGTPLLRRHFQPSNYDYYLEQCKK